MCQLLCLSLREKRVYNGWLFVSDWPEHSIPLSLLSYASLVDVQLNRRATLQPLFYFKAARLHEHIVYVHFDAICHTSSVGTFASKSEGELLNVH